MSTEPVNPYRIDETEVDGAVQSWLVCGPHHAPFRLRDEVSGKVVVRKLAVAGQENDTYLALEPFVVTDERERLYAACDDEDRPITLFGAVSLGKALVEKYVTRPFT